MSREPLSGVTAGLQLGLFLAVAPLQPGVSLLPALGRQEENSFPLFLPEGKMGPLVTHPALLSLSGRQGEKDG